jgi:lysozyme
LIVEDIGADGNTDGADAWKGDDNSDLIANANDTTIRDEFMKWNRSGGKILNGLTKRRAAEAALYFS